MSGAVGAQVDAFSVEVAVADRGEAERDAAYQTALRRVLLANSGDKTLMNRDEVRQGLREAASYVETFRFRTPDPGTLIAEDTPLTETVRRTGEATGLLLVSFDRQRVLELIEGGGDAPRIDAVGDRDAATDPEALPVDPLASVRSALVWLLIEDDSRVILGTDDAARKVRERLREIAGGAGITLDFPSGDTLDAAALRAFDLAAIREASLRYTTDAILVGRVTREAAGATGAVTVDDADVSSATTPGGPAETAADTRSVAGVTIGWQGEWLKAAGDAVEQTITNAARLDEALQDGVEWLAPAGELDRRADYAYGGGSSATEALVWVGSVASTADYATLMQLLEATPGVATVYPKEVRERAMVFAILPRSALPAVASMAASSGLLRRTAPPVDAEDSELVRNAELAFDLVR